MAKVDDMDAVTIVSVKLGEDVLQELAAELALEDKRPGVRRGRGHIIREILMDGLAARRASRLQAEEVVPVEQLQAAPDLITELMVAIKRLDGAHRYGGVVPIEVVRVELASIDRAALDGAILEAERRFLLDASVSQQPTKQQRLDGIARPGRGLIAYLAPREQQTSAAELDDRVVATARRLDAMQRHDGLVPMHLLRPAMGVARADLDACLMKLEREQRIALKIANDPRTVEDASAGIRIEGRGLVYFVVVATLREQPKGGR